MGRDGRRRSTLSSSGFRTFAGCSRIVLTCTLGRMRVRSFVGISVPKRNLIVAAPKHLVFGCTVPRPLHFFCGHPSKGRNLNVAVNGGRVNGLIGSYFGGLNFGRAKSLLSSVGTLKFRCTLISNVSVNVCSITMPRTGGSVLSTDRTRVRGVGRCFHHNLVASSRECEGIIGV